MWSLPYPIPRLRIVPVEFIRVIREIFQRTQYLLVDHEAFAGVLNRKIRLGEARVR